LKFVRHDWDRDPYSVTPLAGVWIEIMMSSPSVPRAVVTPLAGVWIEIINSISLWSVVRVTPLAGVWIEISLLARFLLWLPSHPSRVCGLK